jgi:hypothetical protein
MKVSVTFNLGDEERLAIGRLTQKAHMATYDGVKSWIEQTVMADLQSVRLDYEKYDENGNERVDE